MKVIVDVRVTVEIDEELTDEEARSYAYDEWTNSDNWVILDCEIKR